MTAVESLVNATPTSAHAEYYIDIVRQKHVLRKLINTARETERKCYGGDGRNADVILGEAETAFLGIGGETTVRTDWKSAVDRTFKSIERLFESTGMSEGLPSGFKHIDEKLLGLKKSEMIVIAARPSVGKTSFAMNIAECVAMGADINGRPFEGENGRKHPVLIFSLEMAPEYCLHQGSP